MELMQFPNTKSLIYVVLGIDGNGHDQVVAVFRNYNLAKTYCTKNLMQTDFLDVWIEKHELM